MELKHGDTCPCCGQTVKLKEKPYTCQQCGKEGTYTSKRPRLFCSHRCRQADIRARAKAKREVPA